MWGTDGVPRKNQGVGSLLSLPGVWVSRLRHQQPPPPRSQVDRLVALARMRQSGAFLSTSEGLILQLVRDAAHPQFKEVPAPHPDLPCLPFQHPPRIG